MSSENLNSLSIKDLKKLVNEEYKQNKKYKKKIKRKRNLYKYIKSFKNKMKS